MKHTNKEVQKLVDELKLNYPDYTDEHVNEYAEYMKEEGYTSKQIQTFIIACGY